MTSDSKNRRLSFIAGDDFYFLAYSIFSVLSQFAGNGNNIRDHRKISLLIQCVADDRLVSVLERTVNRTVENPVDRELLFLTFTKAELHKREVFKILFSLEKRGFVKLARTAVAEVFGVELIESKQTQEFLKNNIFDEERKNGSRVKKAVRRISSMSYETLIDRLFTQRGIKVWAS